MIPCNEFIGESDLGRCNILGVGVNKKVVCVSCQQHWKDDKPPTNKDENPYLHALVKIKTASRKLINLATSLTQVKGFASKQTVIDRAKICNQCELIKDKPIIGKTCEACGCTILKIQLDGMSCPLGKW